MSLGLADMRKTKARLRPEAPKTATTGIGPAGARALFIPRDGDGEVVRFEEQGLPALDVWLENETIWLTQAQMAKLFGCAPQNITYHLKQIFAIGELEEAPTCKEILQVQIEGTRSISRKQKFYNLDAIISVGYRVNSILGVKFRQWATAVLKEYLLRGSVRDRRLGKLEKRMDAAERAIDTIIYTLTPALPENRRRIGFGSDEGPAPTKPYGKAKSPSNQRFNAI